MSAATLGKIIIVDKDEAITSLLRLNLGSEGYDISVFSDAAEAAKADMGGVKLVIADAMGEEYDGLRLLEELKGNPMTSHAGFIVCTAHDSESLVIEALDAGADDYVLKPFSLRELVARVKSVIRRYDSKVSGAPGNTINFHTLSVDLISHRVSESGILLKLTKTEYAILVMLLKNADNFVSRLEIYKSIWNGDPSRTNDRIVDTNISRLRKKLGEPIGSHLINRSGTGYMMKL